MLYLKRNDNSLHHTSSEAETSELGNETVVLSHNAAFFWVENPTVVVCMQTVKEPVIGDPWCAVFETCTEGTGEEPKRLHNLKKRCGRNF